MQDSKGKSKLFWNDKTLHTLKQRNSSCMQCFFFGFFFTYISYCVTVQAQVARFGKLHEVLFYQILNV